MADDQADRSNGKDPIPLELGKIVPAAFIGATTILGYSYVHNLFRVAGLSPLMLDDSVFDMAFRGIVLMAMPAALHGTLLIVTVFSGLLILGVRSSLLIVRALAFIAAFAVLFWGAVTLGDRQAGKQLSEYSVKAWGTVVQCDFVERPDNTLSAEAATTLRRLSKNGELRLLTRTSTTVFFIRNKINGSGNVQALAVPSDGVGFCRLDSAVVPASGRASSGFNGSAGAVPTE